MHCRLNSLEISIRTPSRARAYRDLLAQLWHGEIIAFPCLQAFLRDILRYRTAISRLEYNLRKVEDISRETATLTVIR
jgi:hypothetical protein